ncbi:MAG: hypothetical protein U0Y96_16385 [Candidatus Kapaibacterium sp.]
MKSTRLFLIATSLFLSIVCSSCEFFTIPVDYNNKGGDNTYKIFANDFYPLQIGNVWEYHSVFNDIITKDYTSTVAEYKNIKGNQYAVVVTKGTQTVESEVTQFSDTAFIRTAPAGKVYSFDGTNDNIVVDFQAATVSDTTIRLVQPATDVPAKRNDQSNYYIGNIRVEHYGKGVGFVSGHMSGEAPFWSYTNLKRAVINGIEYKP